MEIYTDGACEPNPGRGGWAFVVLDKDNQLEHMNSGFHIETTNNRMEIKAVIEGLKFGISQTTSKTVIICSDSQYTLGLCKKQWKKVKKNHDMVEELNSIIDSAISDGYELDFIWVKGHSGDTGNEAADFYANQACRR